MKNYLRLVGCGSHRRRLSDAAAAPRAFLRGRSRCNPDYVLDFLCGDIKIVGQLGHAVAGLEAIDEVLHAAHRHAPQAGEPNATFGSTSTSAQRYVGSSTAAAQPSSP